MESALSQAEQWAAFIGCPVRVVLKDRTLAPRGTLLAVDPDRWGWCVLVRPDGGTTANSYEQSAIADILPDFK